MEDIRLFSREELIDKFGWTEYAVSIGMFVISTLIGGFFWWRGQNSNADYLLGGRNMGVLPMSMSLAASFMSSVTLLGLPAEVYFNGTAICVVFCSIPLVMYTTAKVFMPVFIKLGISTSHEYLEWRFSKSVRILASISFVIQMSLFMAAVVYAPAIAMSQIVGIDVDLACILIICFCIVYTTVGGIKAVMWTDTFQASVMMVSFIVITVKGINEVGGSSKVFDLSYQTGRVVLLDFNLDPRTPFSTWGALIGGYFSWLALYGVNQTQVQRYLTAPNLSLAKKALWWNSFFVVALVWFCGLAGLVAFSYYYLAGCDPIKAKLVKKGDQIIPLFVMQVLGDLPCFPGLFVSAVFSGALSTVSSGLNSLAAVTMQDFIKLSGLVRTMSDRTANRLTKALAAAYGLVCFGIVTVVKYFPGLTRAAITILGVAGGPNLGTFLLGMFFPWANAKGAMSGNIVGFLVCTWIAVGQYFAHTLKYLQLVPKPLVTDGCPDNLYNATIASVGPDSTSPIESPFYHHLPLYEISNIWLSMIGCVFSFSVGALVSLVSKPQNAQQLNPDLVSPFVLDLAHSRYVPGWLAKLLGLDSIGTDYKDAEKESELRRNQIFQSKADDWKMAVVETAT